MPTLLRNQRGFAHWVVPLLIILVISMIGVRLLTASHADPIGTKVSPVPISITSPVANASIISTQAIMAKVVSTNTVKSVAFYENGTVISGVPLSTCYSGLPVPTPVRNAYILCWDTKNLSNGAYTLTSRVTFTNGVTSNPSLGVKVNVNHGDPPMQTVTITSPVDGATVRGGYVMVYGKTISPSSSVTFLANGTPITPAPFSACFPPNTPVPTLAPNTYAVCWNTKIQGKITLTAQAQSSTGQTVTSPPVNVTVSYPVM